MKRFLQFLPGVVLLLAAQAGWAGAISGKVSAPGTHDSVVYVEKTAATAPKPGPAPKLAQKGTQFVPRVLIVQKGQQVEFPNEDKMFHNVFSLTSGNEFDLGMYRGGASKNFTMNEVGEVEVFCNVHPDMAAHILVLQNSHYAQVAADGSYTINDVPPGSYTLVAWSPAHEPQRQRIEVKATGAAQANFSLKPREQKGHLNKNGEQYGRYK